MGYKLRYIQHLSGGMNDNDDASEIENNEMADCENFEVDQKKIRTAGGYVGYDDATNAGPYWGGYHAKFSDGTNRLIRQRQDTLEYDDGAGSWTECTLPTSGSPATTVTLTQIPCRMEMLNDIIIWTNGTDTVMSSTDGITWTLRSGLPKSKVVFNNGLNRLIYLAQPLAPSKVEWSDINDPLTIGASSYQFIGKNDGQDIVDAVKTPTGGMLLFKTSRFYEISDITMDMIAVDPIGESPICPNTAVATENSAMWTGFDGIYEFSGGIARKISGNIKRTGRMAWGTTAYMCASYFNHKYWLSCPNGSDSYNSQQFVVDRNNPTGKPTNPYLITRNVRYIGCYINEDREVSNVRRKRLYFGDSRTTATGSPATVPGVFAYINDDHDDGVTQGLDGSAQSAYFTTKFFNEKRPFYLKRYTKFFTDLITEQDTEFTLAYRFDHLAQWIEVAKSLEAPSLDIEYDDGDSGDFSEGYGFAAQAVSQVFHDLETQPNIRGIQFKITTNQINDVTFYGLAYKVLSKNNFK